MVNPFIPDEIKVRKITYVENKYAVLRLDLKSMEVYGKPAYAVVEFYANRIVIYPFLTLRAAKTAVRRYLERKKRRCRKGEGDGS